MVATPNFGWWETFRRTHPDVLGNFPELAEGLLSAEGAKGADIRGLRGVGAVALSLAALAAVLHAFALGGILGALREPSASLVTFCREGMRRFPAFLAFTLAAGGSRARVLPLDLRRDRPRDEEPRPGARLGAAGHGASRPSGCSRWSSPWPASSSSPTPCARSGSRAPTCRRSRVSSPVSASALSRPGRLLGVLFFYAAVTAALYLLWLFLDPSAGGEARFALVPLILTQQVFVFLRLLVKVGYYAGDLGGADPHALARILLRLAPKPSAASGAADEPLLEGRPAASRRTR